MQVEYDLSDRVVLVTGAGGALGSSVAAAFDDAGATVCAADILDPDDEDLLLDPDRVHYYQGDFTDEADAERVVGAVVDDHGGLDHLANIAGTWRGGTPIDETDVVIAPTALVNGLPVVTRNLEHFERIDDLAVRSY